MTTSNHVIGLFPTAFMRCEGLADSALVAALMGQAMAGELAPNAQSDQLLHSQLLQAKGNDVLELLVKLLQPKLAEFGELLFGERLPWIVKELWLNRLQPGGYQAMHNHANSFVSGVLYLTHSHPSANTVFMKGPGGRDFAFVNTHAGTSQGPFNADKWVSPDPSPGDLVLFPSYLLHEVPRNLGGLRISLAFNAVPQRLDSWGYGLGFAR